MAPRLLVISPVRNEAAHIERVVSAVANQTRRPDLWMLVDDSSTDGTREILERLASELPFIELVERPAAADGYVKDRLAAAAAPRTFNVGLESTTLADFTHVAKLDGDTELPPCYFESLLGRFAQDPRLGLAGGVRVEHVGGRPQLERVPVRYHVPGALKCYSVECFGAIGGMQERLGWDIIDEVYARMRGFRTQTFPELVALHHRPWGTADGTLRGHARHGRCAYIVHYPLSWVALRGLKVAGSAPRGLSGAAYVGGYLAAAADRAPRVVDPEFRRFFRKELRGRVRAALGSPPFPGRGPGSLSIPGQA